jgi:hypothetical protein
MNRTPLIAIAMLLLACRARPARERAPYSPLAEVEATYGRLITGGNHPTPEQHGTGERIGLFQDASGTVWGLPLSSAQGGAITVCAPPELKSGKVTGTFPEGSTIIGSMNEPTGWRGGTGSLELLMRDRQGNVRWQAVHSARLTSGPSCWAPELPGPPQQLNYYRLSPN